MELNINGIHISMELIIGIFGLLIAFILPVVIYIKSKKNKEIVYNKDIIEPLKIKDEVRSRLKISYDDIPINNLSLITMVFKCSGKEDIKKEDFGKENLVIEFNKEAIILNTDIIEKKPNYLDLQCSSEKNKFILKPILLKSEDFFKIQFSITDYINYQIINRIKDTKVKEAPRKDSSYFLISGVFFIVISIFPTIIAIFNRDLAIYLASFSIFFDAIGFLLMLMPMLWDEDYRKGMIGINKQKATT